MARHVLNTLITDIKSSGVFSIIQGTFLESNNLLFAYSGLTITTW